MTDDTDETLTANLRAHYGAAARRVAQGRPGPVDDTAGPAEARAQNCGPRFGAGLYEPAELELLPPEAAAGSIGCANPVALIDLQPGQDVLDLGSGGGIDVLLSARRVAPDGHAYGLDMTPDMLQLARANQEKAAIANAQFLEGRIEDIPLPDHSVDVVLSNCVINLSADKDAVFAEAFRVLRPGGRLAIADIVADHEPNPDQGTRNAEWAACTAGALSRDRYHAQLDAAGFTAIEMTDSHPVNDGFTSVHVHATKPTP